MREKLKALEKTALELEPDGKQREAIRSKIVAYTEGFLDTINDFDKSPTFRGTNKSKALLDHPISDKPMALDKAIELVADNVDSEGINPASGGHLGYVPGGGIYTSALGDYWADITNRYAGVFFSNPGAVRMETHLINWMKEMIGYPEGALGNLTSGGSIANLTGIVTARDAHGIKAADIHKQVIYLSKQAHHCIDKAINIAGLRECQLRFIDLDEGYRIKIDALKDQITQDKAAGLTPWLIVASAGTTDTGAVDPLDKLGEVAKANNMWLHADAAYGGFFMLTEEGREKLCGMEACDSVVIDPHKGLFLPYATGVVLIKNGHHMRKAFAYQANYLQDAQQAQDEISPAELSPELTKHFRGLRLWLPLMIHGVTPFRACLEEKLLLAKYAYQQLQTMEGFEVGPEPELSIVTFRYVPKGGRDANQFNAALVKAIHEDGRVFLSSTTIEGVFTLRLAILSFRTHLSTIDLALQILQEKVRKLEA